MTNWIKRTKICLVALILQLSLYSVVVRSEQFHFDIYESEDVIEDVESVGGFNQQYTELSDASLLWGPYRSSLYFGIRPRIPHSLLSGLMWFGVDDYGGLHNIRHVYEKYDPVRKANWISYDPRLGGREVIRDDDYHIELTIDYVKSSDGLSWGAKIRGEYMQGFEYNKLALVWYSGLEGESDEINELGLKTRNGYLQLENRPQQEGYRGNIKLGGISEELGMFDIEINDGPASNRHPKGDPKYHFLDPSKTQHLSLAVPDDNTWRAKDIFLALLSDSVEDLLETNGNAVPPEQAFLLRDMKHYQGNLHFVQKVFEGKFEFDIIYTNKLTRPTEMITFDNINEKIDRNLKIFDDKFNDKFQLKAPYDKQSKHLDFAKELLSGLLGGLTYAYGDHLVDRETKFDDESFEEYKLKGSLEGPHELFSLVPSRPFFSRGFLWDEGFHLIPLINYDSDLVFEVLQSWFNLIDEDGWIAREQILGPEARSRVPEEFQVQSPEIVNPPTLMLVFTYLLNNIKDPHNLDLDTPYNVDDITSLDSKNLGSLILNNPKLLYNYTQNIYPKLKTHYEWFKRTQQGLYREFEDRGTNGEVYRWRGRTLTHCLASGIDDYPRALPADIAELNIDLLSWIGVMTRSMKMIAELLHLDEDYEQYKKTEEAIIENIDAIHWSEEHQAYCDVSVDDDDINIHVCHKGYVTLFPFLTKLIPEHEVSKIESIVDLISDPEELWTDFGLRSLSKSDEYYKTEENYWRSPIWININYMALDALQHYYDISKSYMSKELKEKVTSTYHQLRLNIINNIADKWETTGYIWEAYEDDSGKEKGAKNFLGWSSTVLIMMTMPENL
ncbi:glycoside hydrolase [Scheffersomyces amazonensis]|uniref:glycoside hydrolase n=1 Tax=Scheffersomyces amazonensis TaxID=1078765 RepID=UPI00315DD597